MRNVFGVICGLLVFFGVPLAVLLALIKPSWLHTSVQKPSKKRLVISLLIAWVGLLFCSEFGLSGGSWWALGAGLFLVAIGWGLYLDSEVGLKTEPITTPAPTVKVAPTPTQTPAAPITPTPITPTDIELRLDEIMRAIISDNVVSIDEVRYLSNWLDDKPNIGNIGYLRDLLTQYLKDGDGELSEAEADGLLQRFGRLAGVTPAPKPPQDIAHFLEAPAPQRQEATPVALKGLTILFDYVDATREHSRRMVLVKSERLDRVYCYDYGRAAMRTFLKHRMSNIADAETGEVLLA